VPLTQTLPLTSSFALGLCVPIPTLPLFEWGLMKTWFLSPEPVCLPPREPDRQQNGALHILRPRASGHAMAPEMALEQVGGLDHVVVDADEDHVVGRHRRPGYLAPRMT
jgi:hypothetical protein